MKKSPMMLAAAAVLAIGLTGCAAAAAPEETEKPAASPEETEAPATEEPAQTGDTPAWAEGALDAGEKIGEITTDSWKADLYQVGTATTDDDSMFVDKESGENLLPAGSEVVYVNFVFTNVSDEEVPLSISLGSPSMRATSWQYLGGQPSFSSTEAYEGLGLSNDGFVTGSEAPFIVAPGQSFSQATNIAYVPGEEVEAEVTLIPVDEAGELLHDAKQEGTAVITIK